jgi:phosphohistidine swiveling domain-containing protein
MMSRYAALASLPDAAARLEALDAWLARFGHRGPLESDPRQPRFVELRATLRALLQRGPAPAPIKRGRPSFVYASLGRFWFLSDEIREWFRDRLMRWWQRLRERVLDEASRAVEAGWLDRPDDVFFLRSGDLASHPSTWRERSANHRADWERAKRYSLPTTALRDAIEEAMAQRDSTPPCDPPRRFVGIGLGSGTVSGTAVRATDLKPLLNGTALPDSPILIAPTLEPAWAVVFPQFEAVVAELGGEFSHAAILLREAGIPAVINAAGAFEHISDGDRVDVDTIHGAVKIQ